MAHVFVSYVHEDEPQLRPLFSALRRAGIDLWIDRSDLTGGGFWKADIKRAIESGAYFLCCFSRARQEKDRSVAHAELLIAVDQLRLTQFGKRWFIPVRVDDCEIPDIPIFGNETLGSLQWIDLFIDASSGIRRVLEALDVDAETIAGVVGARRLGNRADLPDVNESFAQWHRRAYENLSHSTDAVLSSCRRACAIANNQGLDAAVQRIEVADTKQVLDAYIASVRATMSFYSPYMNGDQFRHASAVQERLSEIERLWRYVDEEGVFSGDYDEDSLENIARNVEEIDDRLSKIGGQAFDPEFDPYQLPSIRER